MKTKKLITTNLIIYAIFFVINILLLFLEKKVKESTSEMIFLAYILILIIVLAIFNKSSYFNIQNKIKRFFVKGLFAALSFIVFYVIIFFFNWFVFYALIK